MVKTAKAFAEQNLNAPNQPSSTDKNSVVKVIHMSADKSRERHNSSYNSNFASSANMTPCISVMKQFRD